MSTRSTVLQITASGQGTDWLPVQAGPYSVSVQGFFVGVIALQRQLDGLAAEDIKVYTDQAAETLLAAEDQKLRLYVYPGDLQSGVITARIGQDKR